VSTSEGKVEIGGRCNEEKLSAACGTDGPGGGDGGPKTSAMFRTQPRRSESDERAPHAHCAHTPLNAR